MYEYISTKHTGLLFHPYLTQVHGLLSRIPTDIPFEKLLVDAQVRAYW